MEDGGWRGGAAEGCPALAGRGEIVGLLPGPPLRSSPGYHIAGLRPLKKARHVFREKSCDTLQRGSTETSASSVEPLSGAVQGIVFGREGQ
jgi:hypothetical protein